MPSSTWSRSSISTVKESNPTPANRQNMLGHVVDSSLVTTFSSSNSSLKSFLKKNKKFWIHFLVLKKQLKLHLVAPFLISHKIDVFHRLKEMMLLKMDSSTTELVEGKNLVCKIDATWFQGFVHMLNQHFTLTNILPFTPNFEKGNFEIWNVCQIKTDKRQ